MILKEDQLLKREARNKTSPKRRNSMDMPPFGTIRRKCS
jgi:hypothetical protein